MSTARIQLFHGPGHPFELREIDLPSSLDAGEMLVELLLATVCGSDLHTSSGRRSAPIPCILGHEGVGRVVASARDGFDVGERITWSIADSCGACPPCREWRLPQKCTRLFKYGHASLADGAGLNGCYATHLVLRARTTAIPVPEDLSDELVAPANCALATVVNALSNLPTPCRSALVQGSGLLGIYACAWLRYRGLERVYLADINQRRLELAAEFGGIPLDARDARWPESRSMVLDENPGGVDLALEVAGNSEVVHQGVDLIRPGGVYVWAGMVHPASSLGITGESIVRKCLTIRGVHNYAPEHLAESLRFLQSTRAEYPYNKIVSPPLPLEELDDAFRMSQRRDWLRVAVKP